MACEFVHFRIVIGGKEVDAATMRDGKVVHLREYRVTAVGGGG